MSFEKSMIYLGKQPMKLSDGSIYYQVQLYDKDSGPVNVNIQASNPNALAFDGLDFGSSVTVTFALRPKDRLYRLTIDHVSM